MCIPTSGAPHFLAVNVPALHFLPQGLALPPSSHFPYNINIPTSVYFFFDFSSVSQDMYIGRLISRESSMERERESARLNQVQHYWDKRTADVLGICSGGVEKGQMDFKNCPHSSTSFSQSSGYGSL